MAKKPRIPNLLDDVVERIGKDAQPEQVVDDIWYHGSPVDIYNTPEKGFKFSTGEAGIPAVWGVRDPFTAEGYARGEISLDYDKALGKFPVTRSYYKDDHLQNGGVYGLRSTAKNPLEFDAGGKQWFELPQGQILRDAKDKGHDAVIFKNIADNYQRSGVTSDVITWLEKSAFEPDREMIELIKKYGIVPAGLLGAGYAMGPSEAQAAPQAPAPQASQSTLGKLYDAVTTNPIGTFKAFGSAIGDSVKDYARSVYNEPSKGVADALELGVTSMGGVVPQAFWMATSPTEANAGEQAILDERIRRIAAQRGLLAD